METWLRTNSRAVLFGTIMPSLIALAGLVMLLVLPADAPSWLRVVGGGVFGAGAVTLMILLWQLRQPRLAYQDRHLLIFLRTGPPFRVPIEFVECFWLGQAPSMLPGKQNENTEVAAVVIRIADKAAEWRHQDVKPQLGKWCEGYVTIRGTWCEPLNIDVVNRLNTRLAEVAPAASQRASS